MTQVRKLTHASVEATHTKYESKQNVGALQIRGWVIISLSVFHLFSSLKSDIFLWDPLTQQQICSVYRWQTQKKSRSPSLRVSGRKAETELRFRYSDWPCVLDHGHPRLPTHDPFWMSWLREGGPHPVLDGTWPRPSSLRAFLSRGTWIQALQDLSPSRCSVLPTVFLERWFYCVF